MDPKREYNIFLRSIHPTINNNFLMNIISELTILPAQLFSTILSDSDLFLLVR